MKHQLFISYSSRDAEIARMLETALGAAGLRSWLAPNEIAIAAKDWPEQISRAIAGSQAMLLLLSKGTVASPKQQKRELAVAEQFQIPVVPVFMVPPQECVDFMYLLANTQHFNATGGSLIERFEALAVDVQKLLHQIELKRLKTQGTSPKDGCTTNDDSISSTGLEQPTGTVSELRDPHSVALLYRRDIPEDEYLVKLLYTALTERGHTVFIDKRLQPGAEWRRVIREKVETADAVIPLLSMSSIWSEMLEEEVQIAAHIRQGTGNRPRILPVRVNFEGNLPPALNHALQNLQYILWKGKEEDDRLIQSLIEAIEKPEPPPTTVKHQSETPGGAVPLNSVFYIQRAQDRVFGRAVVQKDSLVLIKGARQMGKTSLMARGLQDSREQNMRTVTTDLQFLNRSDLTNLRSFYIALGNQLADQLDLDVYIEDAWDDKRADNVNFERYVRREILKPEMPHLVWALDETDRLFPCDFGTEVFGLFRSWYNARAIDPTKPWSRLTLVIAFATEASLFIRDINMSPFNVGNQINMSDFTVEEMEQLNARYGHPVPNQIGIAKLMERIGGQPFLARRSFYAMAVEGKPFEEVLVESSSDSGLFGDHLRRFYISLHQDPELEAAVREFILRGRQLEKDQFDRLRSAGLLVGNSRQDARVRCGIYQDYLKHQLT